MTLTRARMHPSPPHRQLRLNRRGGASAFLAVGAFLLLAHVGANLAWVQLPGPSEHQGQGTKRRDVATQMGAAVAGILFGASNLATPELPATADSSTAGKYSTIPAGKRKYYGRVRQGIYQFLNMEKPIMNGVGAEDPAFQAFFTKTAKTMDDEASKTCWFNECTQKVKRKSQWDEFRRASDLLGSAFRYDANDVNAYLPQVRAIRAFAKKVDKVQVAVNAGDMETAQKNYVKAKRDLEQYLPMVELNDLDSEDYTHEWDTNPVVVCTQSFCVS